MIIGETYWCPSCCVEHVPNENCADYAAMRPLTEQDVIQAENKGYKVGRKHGQEETMATLDPVLTAAKRVRRAYCGGEILPNPDITNLVASLSNFPDIFPETLPLSFQIRADLARLDRLGTALCDAIQRYFPSAEEPRSIFAATEGWRTRHETG